MDDPVDDPVEELNRLRDEAAPRARTAREAILDRVRASGATFFHDSDGTSFAAIPAGDHTEVHSVRSRAFRLWIAGLYYRSEGAGLPANGPGRGHHNHRGDGPLRRAGGAGVRPDGGR